MPYLVPPQAIVDAIDTPPTPTILQSPDRRRMLLIEHDLYPPIALLARPFLRLGGVRVDPAAGARQRTTRITKFTIVTVEGGDSIDIQVPDGSSLGMPVWSSNGKHIAFTRDLEDGSDLWIADTATGEARVVDGLRVNNVIAAGGAGGLGVGSPPFHWTRNSSTLLALGVPSDRGPRPERARVPDGPRIEESFGKKTQMATFQDLLKDEHDDEAFEYFATSILTAVDVETLSTKPLGEPGLITSARPSPSDAYLLVHRIKRPFSHRVPYSYFARSTEVWDRAGATITTIADLPVSDEVPRQGVPRGPRNIMWQEKRPATLVWMEALDGGDPLNKVPHRDRVMRLELPTTTPTEVMRVADRVNGWTWLDREDVAFVTEFDRDRRWRTTAAVDLRDPDNTRRVLWDLSVNDVYNAPGAPLMEHRANGEHVVLEHDGWIFLSGGGATEEGSRPFLRRFELSTGTTEELWRCGDDVYEAPIAFAPRTGIPGPGTLLTRRQSPTEPQNIFAVDLQTGTCRQLTDFPDPHPHLTGAFKQLVRYERNDGVPLSGTLYLPPGRTVGDGGPRMPTLIWAYPMDYSDPDTAGQVRGSDRTFTRLAGISPLWFLTDGYAVLMDATMPVVGDPETMNDTFVEQVVAAAEAAVAKLDELGVADTDRLVVSGHSYGGFMTATLLAHTDLFRTGIARSGAYNRSLTPFGFQTERRSYWEVPQIYQRVSPFSYAHQITAPILLIHGEEDNNSGTFPIQSERFFQAIQGNGGTARLVLLPHEGHGYRARESVLHVIAEMLTWARTYAAPRG